MPFLRSLRSLRSAVVRSKGALLFALALFTGAGAAANAVQEWPRFAASIVMTILFVSAVYFRKHWKMAAYALSGFALLVYVAFIRPEDLTSALLIAYPLLLFCSLLLRHPVLALSAALAIGVNLYMVGGPTGSNDWIVHLVLIFLNAIAYTVLARHTRRLEQERNEYRHLSMIDSLTGLASLQQTLLFGQKLIDEGKRVRVLLIDLNFFKQINDTYGHMVGNKVILLVADYLRQLIRGENGIAGRLGGDEFVVMVEDAPHFANMRTKLLEELNGKSFVPDEGIEPVSLSFSVGVAVSSGDTSEQIEDVLHNADLNMYEFKLHHRLPTFQGKTADLIEHNPDPICTFDRKGRLLAINPAASKLLGYSAEEMTRRQFLSFIHPDDRMKALTHFQETLKGNSRQFELKLIHKGGREIIADVTNIPIIADHEIVGIYGVAKDVTDRKQAEEMLRNSERLAVMGQLAAGLAHEIRNPLTALKGFIQLLQSSPKDNKAYYPIMLNELERINFILNEFLLLAKPRPAQFEETDIALVINHVVMLLDTQAILNKVRIVTDDAGDIPPIRCDGNQMKQVFVNVLKNAIEAMPEGGQVTIRTDRSDDRVKVSVTDEGPGIPQELLAKLGQPFFTTKEKGTGLGLMICQNIMENHGGKLTIGSTPGCGTTVEIELPFA